MNAPQDVAVLGTRVITVNLPPKQELVARANAMLASAESLIIDSESMHEIAADELRSIKTGAAKLEEARKMHVSPLNEEVKYINDWFREARSTMELAEADIKLKMLGYQETQERRRREEQRRIEEEQRAERSRIAAENAARERASREEAQRKNAEQEAALQKEREAQQESARRRMEIDAAIRAGNQQEAQEATRLQMEAEETAARERASAERAERERAAIIAAAAEQSAASETALEVMTAPVVSLVQKVTGIATKGTYKGKVTDFLALVQFVAKNPQYLNLLKANDTAINQIAKAQREATKIDGVLVWEERTIAARRA